jgi:SAM-dependent methyltransferase
MPKPAASTWFVGFGWLLWTGASFGRLRTNWTSWLMLDYRTPASVAAAHPVVEGGGFVLGLGGGPRRLHPTIVNLNVEPFENVDIVGDAHRLPLPDNAVDAVHCEAVFEHLRDPEDAAAEMFRVMKPGALAFVCTPFMQAFHAYPSHFQNFTLMGHYRLFERAGFRVVEHGVCVGPSVALSDLVATYITHYSPRVVRWLLRAAWSVLSRVLVRPLDRSLARRDNAHLMASTTYALIENLVTRAGEADPPQFSSVRRWRQPSAAVAGRRRRVTLLRGRCTTPGPTSTPASAFATPRRKATRASNRLRAWRIIGLPKARRCAASGGIKHASERVGGT